MIAEPVKRTAEIELARHRFTVAEYMRMAEVELLGEDSRSDGSKSIASRGRTAIAPSRATRQARRCRRWPLPM